MSETTVRKQEKFKSMRQIKILKMTCTYLFLFLLAIAILCVAFEKELTASILIALISLPLWFGKKRYIEI